VRIFGTEETREIDTVVIPKSVNDSSQTARVFFLLLSKRRQSLVLFASFTKGYYSKIVREMRDEEDALMKRELQDALCKSCPRCVLFGAMSTDSGDNLDKSVCLFLF
jgi:hypothetical protein